MTYGSATTEAGDPAGWAGGDPPPPHRLALAGNSAIKGRGGADAGRTGAGKGIKDVGGLLKASRVIDAVNDRFGTLATWLVLFACVISTGNAISRYAFDSSSNAWLELQWYMFAAMVFFGAPYTLKVNEHVRVDVFYSALPERARIWIDILGGLFFLLPFCAVLLYFTWPWFLDSWRIGEMSSNAGGLIRWPVKLVLPLGFALLALQGISELIKRIAALTDSYRLEYRYETPLQ